MVQPQVFVSIGSPRSEAQRRFKLDLLDALRAHGVSPRTVGRSPEDTDATYARPFDQICQIVGESHGAVVVAYQKHLAQRFESDYLSAENHRSLAEVKLSTAWNQAEAAIAYRTRVPLLMICEEGVYREGIFDNEGVAVRAGHHCAQPVMLRYDIPATTRASFYVYNDLDDIDALTSAIRATQTLFAD